MAMLVRLCSHCTSGETERRGKCTGSDRASVHSRNAAFEAVFAPEQYCSGPLLKVERSVSDRFLKRSESNLNTSIGEEIASGTSYWLMVFSNQKGALQIV